MSSASPSSKPLLPALLLSGLLFLFFFQLLTDFIAAVYAFGLAGLEIPPEIVVVLLLLAPLALVFLRRPVGRRGLALLAGLAIVCRVIEPLLATRGRMIVSGVGVAGLLLYFPGWLAAWSERRRREKNEGVYFGLSLAVGLALSILLRAAGSGLDLSTLGMFQAAGWGLALLALALLVARPGLALPEGEPLPPDSTEPGGGTGRTLVMSLGMMAVLTLLYFAFTAPNVIARWSGSSYLVVLALLCVGLAAFVALLAGAGRPLASLPPWAIGLWNAAFVVCLASGLRLFQIDFPAQPGAYPLAQPDWPAWRALPLLLSVLLSPVILLDFGLYGREILRLRPTMRQLGAGFGLGALFLLLLTLAHVFTTVYDYIPVVGPFFRDRFWLVYLVAGLGAALPLLAVDWRCYPSEARAGQAQPRGWGGAGAAAWLAGGFLSLALLAAAFWELRPVVAVESGNQLRVLTFNIQQGYNANGRKNYLGQLGVLYRARPEVIGLEESDTNRLSGSNDDLVRFLANQLGMHEYYSPNTTVGTFGLALLSKYPIEAPRTFYFYSEGEQTAAITARIRKGDRVFNVFVTHLGNGGPLVQQEALLKLVAGQPDVIAMGDFNFDPSEEQYRRMVQVLADAWLLRWPSGSDDRGYNPSGRIDHVFVSPGTQVSEARFLTGPASDHPALLVQVGW